jgi:serine protease Do
MHRFDKAVIVLVLICAAAAILGRNLISYDPAAGRRPPPSASSPLDRTAPPPEVSPGSTKPTYPQRVRRPPLEPPSAQDPVFEVEPDQVKSGDVLLGTAFSVDSRGIWLTARHVANEDCRQLAIIAEGHRVEAEIAYVDPKMDVTVLRTRGGTTALPLATDTPLVGESGYSFGYPTGVLGATEDTLMGRSRMQGSGRLAGLTPTLTWSEQRRLPDSLDSLGGMSGGPMLDDSGRVVGSVVATSIRRGRVHTVAPEVLSETGQETHLFGATTPAAAVSEIADRSEALSDIASELNDTARIVKVYCRER